jgi:hypothetical protein
MVISGLVTFTKLKLHSSSSIMRSIVHRAMTSLIFVNFRILSEHKEFEYWVSCLWTLDIARLLFDWITTQPGCLYWLVKCLIYLLSEILVVHVFNISSSYQSLDRKQKIVFDLWTCVRTDILVHSFYCRYILNVWSMLNVVGGDYWMLKHQGDMKLVGSCSKKVVEYAGTLIFSCACTSR